MSEAAVSRRESGGDVVRLSEAAVVKIARDLTNEIHPHRRAAKQAGLDSSLERDWGFDSLSRAELLLRIERAFSGRIPERLLGEAETLRDLVSALADAKATPREAADIRPHTPAPPATPAPDTTTTLTDVLDWHVRHHADRTHVVLLDGEGGESTITYRQLLTEASAVAHGLAARRLEPGARVAIMLPTSRAFFAAFFGILYAGGVPVPVYPPARWSQIEEHLRRQAGILRNARASILVTAPEASNVARLLRLHVGSLRSIETVDELAAVGSRGPLPEAPRGASMALLQYTSGSTGDPKGVVLTHTNLLANIRAMGQAMDASPADVFASWLPLYHDMGLIGAWLGCLYFAAPLVVMSPLAFIVRPEEWLWAIHRHRATLSAAPNFAFELCLRKVEDAAIAGLDLGSLRMVANGAEAVRPETIGRFVERFAPYGFRREAMVPVYGLAECAVGVAFPPPGRSPVIDRIAGTALARHGRATRAEAESTDALEFVGCGHPLPGHQVRIVDAAGEVPERREGRLQFRGPSATSGYFENPGKTRELFDGDWLDSGDLAYAADGELFITGRSKDIVIRAGRNIYPEEIETAIGNIQGIRKGCVAVFGAPDPQSGTERLVVVAETRETGAGQQAELRQEIRRTAARLLESPPEEIRLMPPGSVPKTSSGKLRRAAARDLFRQGRLGARPQPAFRQLARLLLAGLGNRLRGKARTVGGFAYAAWWWFALLVASSIMWPLVLLLPGRRQRWAVVRTTARRLLRLMRIDVEVTGIWPAAGIGIIAVNHGSYIDGLVLASVLPDEPAFVAKKELAAQVVAGPFLRALGTLFVERTDPEGGVEDARKVLEAAGKGRALVFFPEGTLTRVVGLRPFRLGAFTIAAQHQVAVLPVTLRGTRSVLRGEQWLPRRGDVSIHIGEPIASSGSDFVAAVQLRDRVRAAILARCGEPDLSQG